MNTAKALWLMNQKSIVHVLLSSEVPICAFTSRYSTCISNFVPLYVL